MSKGVKRPFRFNRTRDGKVECLATFALFHRAWERMLRWERTFPCTSGTYHIAHKGKRLV